MEKLEADGVASDTLDSAPAAEELDTAPAADVEADGVLKAATATSMDGGGACRRNDRCSRSNRSARLEKEDDFEDGPRCEWLLCRW